MIITSKSPAAVKAAKMLEKAQYSLLRSEHTRALSGVILMGDKTVTDRIKTGATDGINEVYNPEFVTALPQKQVNYLVLHEVLHKALKHLTVWRELSKRDHDRANRAADYVVNATIEQELDPCGEVTEPIAGRLFDRAYEGMNVREIFDRLPPGDNRKQGGEGPELDGPLDDHDWEGADGITPGQQREIDRVVRQGSMAGKKKLPSHMTDTVTPWEEVLRAFVTEAVAKGRDDSSWARPSRRWLARGEYRPSPVGSSMTRLVVAVDTSGSITAADLAQFMGEINAACRAAQPEWLSVLWWDAALAGEDHVYQPADADVSHVLRPAGGGGTDPSVLVPRMDQFSPPANVLVVLTDGMFDKYPAFKVPTLWALTSTINRDTPPAGAVVVHI